MWGILFSRGTKFVHVLNLRTDEGIPDPFYVTNDFYVDFLADAKLLSCKRRPTSDYSLKIRCHQTCCTCRSKTDEAPYLRQHAVFSFYG